MAKRPNGGRRIKGQSECFDWIKAHVNYVGDECLIWPYSRDNHGYGIVSVRPLTGEKAIRKASRVMCELAHGKPPTPKHECAHSCGRGHDACINPGHLSWKTRSENQRDRRKHGTHGRGPLMNALKQGHRLTPQKVAEMRAIGRSVTLAELGRRFGVTPSNVAKILDGKAWKTGDWPKRGFLPGDPRNPSVQKRLAREARSR